MHSDARDRQILHLTVTSMGELTGSLEAFLSTPEAQSGHDLVFDLRRLSSGNHDDAGWPGSVDIHAVTRWERVLHRVEQCDNLVLSLLGAECSGPALEIALASDIRIASPQTVIHAGRNDTEQWPSMALFRLVRQVGLGHGRRIVMLSQVVDAEQALAIGLVDSVSADFEETLQLLSSQLGDGVGTRITRNLLVDSTSEEFAEALGTHLAACDRFIRNSAVDN